MIGIFYNFIIINKSQYNYHIMYFFYNNIIVAQELNLYKYITHIVICNLFFLIILNNNE